MLKNYFVEVAGDDFAFGCMSFRFGSFDRLTSELLARARYVEENYIVPLQNGRSEAFVADLWQEYRTSYERYIN